MPLSFFLLADFLVYLLVCLQVHYFRDTPLRRAGEETGEVQSDLFRFQFWLDYIKVRCMYDLSFISVVALKSPHGGAPCMLSKQKSGRFLSVSYSSTKEHSCLCFALTAYYGLHSQRTMVRTHNVLWLALTMYCG